MRRLLLGLVLVTAAGAGASRAESEKVDDARGIIVSCWRWGYEWADPEMRLLMTQLPRVGANWVAIHPYAHVSREHGVVQWSPDDRTDHIRRPIEWARELGLRIMIKPHISYWGEFSWRGEVGWPDGDPRWEVFQASYADWIEHVAEVSGEEGADLFVVGTELRQTEQMTDFWANVIRRVRAVYPGPLTYAANWDDYQAVPFWSELDYVGVQAYFPLSRESDPTEAAIRKGWREPVAEMSKLSREVDRPVILTEIGYTNAPYAAREPWRGHRGEGSTELQARCLRVALEVAREAPAIRGAFIWKWFPTTDPLGPGDFTVQTNEFKALLAEIWGGSYRPEAAPVRGTQ